MLRRKYKKMRKKRGGSGSVGFFDKFKSGFATIAKTTRKGLSKTQEGINKAKIGVREAKENYDAEINKAREGGEYSPLAKKVLEGSVNKNIRKDPVGYVAAQQHWMKDTGVPTTFDRNPLFEPVKPKRKRQFTLGTDSNIKRRIELDGGRRKRKTRRRKKRGGKDGDPVLGTHIFVSWPHDDGSRKYYTGKFMGRYNNNDDKWYKWAEWDVVNQKYKTKLGLLETTYPFSTTTPEEEIAAEGLTEMGAVDTEVIISAGGGRKRKTRRRRKRKTHKKKRKKRRKTRRRR